MAITPLNPFTNVVLVPTATPYSLAVATELDDENALRVEVVIGTNDDRVIRVAQSMGAGLVDADGLGMAVALDSSGVLALYRHLSTALAAADVVPVVEIADSGQRPGTSDGATVYVQNPFTGEHQAASSTVSPPSTGDTDLAALAKHLEAAPAAVVQTLAALLTHDDEATHRLGALASARTVLGDVTLGELLVAAQYLSAGEVPAEEAAL